MPQPLSRVKKKAEVEVNQGGLMAHPNFALMVMRVIATWSFIDSTLAGLLVGIMKADIAAGAAMYQALTGSEARRTVLLAAVDSNQPEWQQLLLRAVLKAIKPSRDQRNDFAHSVWASSKQLPDALLLIPPDANAELIVRRRKIEDIYMSDAHVPDEDRNPDFDRDKIQVWREKDFSQAVASASEAAHLTDSLSYAIGEHRHEIRRRMLLNEPLVQQALRQLILGSSPEVQAQLRPPGDDPPPRGIHPMWDEYWDRIERGKIHPKG